MVRSSYRFMYVFYTYRIAGMVCFYIYLGVSFDV